MQGSAELGCRAEHATTAQPFIGLHPVLLSLGPSRGVVTKWACLGAASAGVWEWSKSDLWKSCWMWVEPGTRAELSGAAIGRG